MHASRYLTNVNTGPGCRPEPVPACSHPLQVEHFADRFCQSGVPFDDVELQFRAAAGVAWQLPIVRPFHGQDMLSKSSETACASELQLGLLSAPWNNRAVPRNQMQRWGRSEACVEEGWCPAFRLKCSSSAWESRAGLDTTTSNTLITSNAALAVSLVPGVRLSSACMCGT